MDSSSSLTRRRWWIASGVATAGLLIVLVQLWAVKNGQIPDADQLTNSAEINAFLDQPANWETAGRSDAVRVPTGAFIQSLRFVTATDVHMTGYVWQHFPEKQTEPIEVGFVLPELVDSSVPIQMAYRRDHQDGVGEVIGWYFEGVVRQPFEYVDYPFDHKTVWLKIWPRDFDANTVLTPDFAAYSSTAENELFGIEQGIVLGDWIQENTYFDYHNAEYTSDFGIRDYVGQENFPELRFNVLIKRKFVNAFIVNLVPLFVVAMLAFAALMTTTRDRERGSLFGFSTTGAIGSVSALFFVVLLAHIQLRQQFAGGGIVYMEWFYFVMYVVLLGVAVNTYLVAAPWSKKAWLVAFEDNLLPKVTFWPVLIVSMVIVTIRTL